jgi:uncharacterized protein (DUF924 family)
MSEVQPDDVLAFWFGEPATTMPDLMVKIRRWFRGGPAFDDEVRAKFGQTTEDALAGKLDAWLAHPKGWLALLIVLDQLTRNIFRGNPRTHAGDPRAVALALEAIESGRYDALGFEERGFAHTPLLHAEDLALQERFAELVTKFVASVPEAVRPGWSAGLEQSKKYLDIIKRFGRFPHRNEILGRQSTPEEIEFLRTWSQNAAPAVEKKL